MPGALSPHAIATAPAQVPHGCLGYVLSASPVRPMASCGSANCVRDTPQPQPQPQCSSPELFSRKTVRGPTTLKVPKSRYASLPLSILRVRGTGVARVPLGVTVQASTSISVMHGRGRLEPLEHLRQLPFEQSQSAICRWTVRNCSVTSACSRGRMARHSPLSSSAVSALRLARESPKARARRINRSRWHCVGTLPIPCSTPA